MGTKIRLSSKDQIKSNRFLFNRIGYSNDDTRSHTSSTDYQTYSQSDKDYSDNEVSDNEVSDDDRAMIYYSQSQMQKVQKP